MKKRHSKDELILDDYFEEDEYNVDDSFYSVTTNNNDLSDEEKDYENFFKIKEKNTNYDNDYFEEDDEHNDNNILNKSDNSFYNILSFVSTWFIRAGIAIMIILVVVFLVQWKLKSLLLYIIGLCVSFVLGYLFMYLLMSFTNN